MKINLIFLILVFGLSIASSQGVEELLLLGEEKLENNYSIDPFAKFRHLFDHEENFVSSYDYAYSGNKYFYEFQIGEIVFRLERFNFATVNKKVNRLYTFGKSPYPSDCGGSYCSVRGFQIYDLKGNLIKNDSIFFTSFSNSFFAISDNGNLYIGGKTPNFDKLQISKYDLNGKLVWQKSIPSAVNNVFSLKLNDSKNETLAVFEGNNMGLSSSKISIIEGNSGQLIWQQNMAYRSRLILYNDRDILFGLFTDVIHHSIINDTTYQIQTLLQLPNQLLSSDDSGKYFGGFEYTKSKTEIPFVLYKKVGDEFVLFKKIDLSKYNFTRDSKSFIKPYCVMKITSNGEVWIFQENKKLRFK